MPTIEQDAPASSVQAAIAHYDAIAVGASPGEMKLAEERLFNTRAAHLGDFRRKLDFLSTNLPDPRIDELLEDIDQLEEGAGSPGKVAYRAAMALESIELAIEQVAALAGLLATSAVLDERNQLAIGALADAIGGVGTKVEEAKGQFTALFDGWDG